MSFKSNELIFVIAGARPNFMKVAPLIFHLKKNNFNFKLIHTGQHYDYNMSKIFFEELSIPNPDIHLNVGSASHAVQTANIMIEFEKVIIKEKPSLVIVVGDVNSTIACALVAKKMNIRVAHIESGLRSFDLNMPEEINRLLTDRISDFLFTSEISGTTNLKNEGIPKEKIFFVGNIMIDTLIMNKDKIKNLDYYSTLGLEKDSYVLMTIHRPSNVDNLKKLEMIVEIINFIQSKMTVVIPLHPRTKKNLIRNNLLSKIKNENIKLIDPLGYLRFINLINNSKLIMTDSGGIQEEASYLKKPILTLRENTERPVTINEGTNTLVGIDLNLIKLKLEEILSGNYKSGKDIEKWDGKTANRIVKILKKDL